MRLPILAILVSATLVASCAGPCSNGDTAIFSARFEQDIVGQAPSLTRQFGSPGASLTLDGKATVATSPLIASRKGVMLERTTIPPETHLVATASAPIVKGVAYVTWRGYAAETTKFPGEALTLVVRSSAGDPVVTLKLVDRTWRVLDAAGVERLELIGSYDPTKDHRLLIQCFPLRKLFDICIDGDELVKDMLYESMQATDVQVVEASLPMMITALAEVTFVADLIRIAK